MYNRFLEKKNFFLDIKTKHKLTAGWKTQLSPMQNLKALTTGTEVSYIHVMLSLFPSMTS